MAAAALSAIPAAKAMGGEVAGVVRSVIQALEKPIYSNLTTEVVTHVAKNGDVITRTRTKGWTVPLGLVVVGVGAIAVWETGNFIAKGLAKTVGVVDDLASVMNPLAWGKIVVDAEGIALGFIAAETQQFYDFFTGQPGPTPTVSANGAPVSTYYRPPTAMASLSYLHQQLLDPISAIANRMGTMAINKLSGGSFTVGVSPTVQGTPSPPTSSSSGTGTPPPTPNAAQYAVPNTGKCADGWTKMVRQSTSDATVWSWVCVRNDLVASYESGGGDPGFSYVPGN